MVQKIIPKQVRAELTFCSYDEVIATTGNADLVFGIDGTVKKMAE